MKEFFLREGMTMKACYGTMRILKHTACYVFEFLKLSDLTVNSQIFIV